jgi:hypothetical protein
MLSVIKTVSNLVSKSSVEQITAVEDYSPRRLSLIESIS